MTTIIGLETVLGEETIILGADSQISLLDEKDKGVGKIQRRKIIVGPFYSLAIAGTDTREVLKLSGRLEGTKKYLQEEEKTGDIVKKAFERYEKGEKMRQFDEVNYVNAIRTKEKKASTDTGDLIEMVIACQNPFGLWHVDIYGTITSFSKDRDTFPEDREYPYVVVGSGSDEVKKFFDLTLDEEGKYSPAGVDLPTGIELVYQALVKSTKDFYTGRPFGIVVVKKDSIDDYVGDMLKSFKTAEESVIANIKNEYTKI